MGLTALPLALLSILHLEREYLPSILDAETFDHMLSYDFVSSQECVLILTLTVFLILTLTVFVIFLTITFSIPTQQALFARLVTVGQG